MEGCWPVDKQQSQIRDNSDCVKKAVGYSNSLIERLRQQRENNVTLCDMILCVEDQLFHVHK